MTDNELCNELHKRAEEYFLKCQKEFAIEELVRIKDEMEDLSLYSTNGNSPENVFLLTKGLLISVIDEHISELKGD